MDKHALWIRQRTLVTKSITDRVHFLTEKIPVGKEGQGTLIHFPCRYWSEIGSGLGEPAGIIPPRIPSNTPGVIIIFCFCISAFLTHEEQNIP